MKILYTLATIAILTFTLNAQVKKSNDSKPINKEIKTQPLVKKTASIEPVGLLRFTATAYSIRGKMANGQNVHVGAIAADPRVLPLGTVVEIIGMGTFIVKDTGGAIKGNRIDIWMPNRKDAIKFGRKTIKVKISSKSNKNKK